jgi:hypothetical protein
VAVTVSGWFTNNFITFNSVAQTGALGGSLLLATHKISLWVSTITPNFDDTLANSRYGAGQYVAGANEVSGTGWAAGGVLLSAAAAGATSTAPTLTVSPAGAMMWDMNDIAVSSTTLTNARCCMIYADAITAPSADPAIILVDFGSNFSTVAGTFGIQWSVLGVSAIDLTP